MLVLLLALTGGTAMAGFELQREQDGCRLLLGDTEQDGVIPMRAECSWPRIPPEELAAIIDDVEGHDEVFSRVGEVRMLEGGRASGRLWHHHEVPMIADREVEFRWERQDGPGHTTWRWWTIAPSVPLTPGRAACERWEGRWVLRSDGSGGSTLLHENYYDSGNFPAWLIRPFLAGELAGLMREVRVAAASPTGAS